MYMYLISERERKRERERDSMYYHLAWNLAVKQNSLTNIYTQ